MSISSSLNNAISGLTATSRMAEVVSSNLANALTEGYGRRSVSLSSVNLAGQGAGVSIDGVRRHVDQVSLADRRLASADMFNKRHTADGLVQLEQIAGKADDPSGIVGRIAALEQSLISAESDPASDQRLSLVVTRLDQVTGTLNNMTNQIQEMRQNADADITRDIDILNTSLKQVEELNADITRTTINGGDSSALLDSRQIVIDRIAEIVPVRTLSRDNGALALMTTSGELMLDGPAASYEYTGSSTIVADMTFAGGVLGGISRDGRPLSTADGVGKLSGGRLGASFQLRDQILTDAQRDVDLLAADLITRFEDANVDPTWIAGSPGLLTDAGAAYNVADLDGLAGRISINASVDPNNGGQLSRLRDGVAAVTSGPVGNSDQLTSWLGALSDSHTIGAGIPAASAAGQAGRVVSGFGGARVLMEQSETFAVSRWETLNNAVLSDGVDSDQELQLLLRIEQNYAANAKVIQTVDQMLRSLMEI